MNSSRISITLGWLGALSVLIFSCQPKPEPPDPLSAFVNTTLGGVSTKMIPSLLNSQKGWTCEGTATNETFRDTIPPCPPCLPQSFDLIAGEDHVGELKYESVEADCAKIEISFDNFDGDASALEAKKKTQASFEVPPGHLSVIRHTYMKAANIVKLTSIAWCQRLPISAQSSNRIAGDQNLEAVRTIEFTPDRLVVGAIVRRSPVLEEMSAK